MSELSSYMRGVRGKERMGAQVRQLQEAIAKRNERIKELEATITTMHNEADIVQIGSNRRWDLLEEARTNFYHIDLGTTGNETASELAHRMAEKIHLELYEDLETNKD